MTTTEPTMRITTRVTPSFTTPAVTHSRGARRALFRSAAAVLATVATVAPLARADAQAASGAAAGARVGTLLVAHGGGAGWNARVDSIARAVRTGGPVAVSFLMGPAAATRRFQEAVRQLAGQGAREIVIVPLLVSSHSGHYEQIRYLAGATDTLDSVMREHLAMAGIARPSGVPVRLSVARAMDDAPELAQALADRARDAAARTGRGDPAGQALFLVGHGSNSAEDHAAWMAALRPVAERVRVATGFRDVKVGLIRDDAPPAVRAEAVLGIRETIALQRAATGRPVLVVPILVSAGAVSQAKVPADLAGLDVVYAPAPLLPHDAIARLVERRVRETAAAGARGN